MKIIYIAHPISGDVAGNLRKIKQIVRMINLEYPDVVPLVPYYVDCLALDDSNPIERQRGIDNDTAILKSGLINEMWLYGDRISNGMRAEIELAKSMGMPVCSMSLGTALFDTLTEAI